MKFIDHAELGDHPNYDDLYEEVLKVAKTAPNHSFAIEVGTRQGGSALTIMDAIHEANPSQWLLTIDPYGDKPYLSEDMVIEGWYKDDFYRTAMYELSKYAHEHNINWAHYKMKSIDWIKTWPKTEFWAEKQILKPQFYFVHLDGDHTDDTVRNELAEFWPYLIEGGVICVDDANQIHPEEVFGKLNFTIEKNRVWLTKKTQTKDKQ